jgi:hypothetical protein
MPITLAALASAMSALSCVSFVVARIVVTVSAPPKKPPWKSKVDARLLVCQILEKTNEGYRSLSPTLGQRGTVEYLLSPLLTCHRELRER